MQVTEVANDGLKRAYTILVPAADIAAERTRRLDELGRDLRLPGFRPGKIPATVVKQRYGQAVMSEVLEQSVNKATQQVVTDRGLRPALQPKIELVNFADGADLEFKFEVEVLPEIPMPDFAGIEVERLKAEPAEAQVAQTIEQIAARNRKLEDLTEDRGAAKGEVAVCDFVGRLVAASANLLADPVVPGANALPKSWRLHGEKEGTASLVGTGEAEGFAYADIRFQGQMKAARVDFIRSPIPAGTGTEFSLGAAVQLLAGSLPAGARAQFVLVARNAEGKGVKNAVGNLTLPTEAPLADQRQAATLAAETDEAGTAIAGVIPLFQIGRLGEEPVDFTLRIAAPSLATAAGGEVEAEPFPGGTATEMPIEVGGTGFIPGFTEQLEGIKAGESRQVKVAFPAEYGAKELAGRAAVFEVTCKSLKTPVNPVADDELAKTMGFEDLAKLQEAVRGSLQQEYDNLSRLKVKRALLDGLAERASFGVPEGMVEAEFAQIWQRIEADMKAERLDEDDKGKDEATLKADYRAIAERRIRLGLLLSEIGRTNNITVTADELSRAMRQEAARYPGQEQQVMEFFRKNPQAAENLRSPIFEEKVVDFMLELAKVTERTVAPEELSAAAAA
ncbi:MAG: Trigger factor, ppiase [Belnapia sp.]|nr:Trigger factor, ppiase [Belnapia sp.]